MSVPRNPATMPTVGALKKKTVDGEVMPLLRHCRPKKAWARLKERICSAD